MIPTPVHPKEQGLGRAQTVPPAKFPQTWVAATVVISCVHPASQVDVLEQPAGTLKVALWRSWLLLQFQS
jgi:hypothetical protein